MQVKFRDSCNVSYSEWLLCNVNKENVSSDLTRTHIHLAKIKACRKGAADSRLVTQGTVSASLGLVSAAHPNMQ